MFGFSLLDPTYPPPPGGPYPYSQTGGNLQWSVGPWGAWGGRMPGFASPSNGVYVTQSPAAGVTVILGPRGTMLKLEQDGRLLPCTGADRGPQEFDLFAAPNVPSVQPPRRSGRLQMGPDSASLARMTRLMLTADVEISQGLASSRKGCRYNFANTVFAVILNDHSVHPAQVFFYQLFFSRLCGTGDAIRLEPCDSPVQMGQFAEQNPYGTDDLLPLAGQSLLVPGTPEDIHVELLSRLARAIQTARGGIDKNLFDWTIGQIYLGQIIYGDVELQSAWRNVSLTAQTP